MPIDIILTILFRLTLFALLAYKITMLVKAHVIPILFEVILEEKKQHTELLEKDKLLISTQQRIENQIIQQKKVFSVLEKNAQEWNQSLLAAQAMQEKTNATITQAVEEKRKLQQKNLTLAKDNLYIVPKICFEAQKQLSDLLAGEKGEKILLTFIQQWTLQKHPVTKN
jgi:hypothetical protein